MNDTAITTGRRAWWRTGHTSLVNPKTVLALVGVSLTWVISLTGLQRHAPMGLPAHVQAWAHECPSCGTVESVATLTLTQPPSELATYFYRLTIRMADGSIRRFEQSVPIAPGSQVLVQNGGVSPVAANTWPARRQ